MPVMHRAVTLLFPLLLAACDKPPSAPPPPALARPLLALSASAGRVAIPQAALVERGGLPGVFVLSAEGTARFRMLRTGKRADGRIEILSGLHGDETLVLGDLHEVRDGSRIETRPAANERR